MFFLSKKNGKFFLIESSVVRDVARGLNSKFSPIYPMENFLITILLDKKMWIELLMQVGTIKILYLFSTLFMLYLQDYLSSSLFMLYL